MKNIFTLAFMMVTFGFSLAHASLHPCTPVIEARPLILSCTNKGVYYGVRIHTVMSDVRRCPVKDVIEIQTARVKIGDVEGNIFETLTIPQGEFSYTLGNLGEGTFKSEAHGLDLNDCASPVTGGFSVGN